MRGNGEPLPSLFYESWEYKDEKTKEILEFPPLVLDNDEKGISIRNAVPIIRGITATQSSNNTMHTYLKASFENGSLRLLKHSTEMDEAYKSDQMSIEEFLMYIQTDLMIQELSNIKQIMSNSGNIIYDRIVKTVKRDRATSLAYGISIVNEMEEENRKNVKDSDYDFVFSFS